MLLLCFSYCLLGGLSTVKVHMIEPYTRTDSTTDLKKFVFIFSLRFDFHIVCILFNVTHALLIGYYSNIIMLFPKSGNLEEVGNYRGIALFAIASKITNKMILNRIQPHIDPILRPNQNGFRPRRSRISHIIALRRLIEGVKSHNLKATIIFVDIKKAFDSINRSIMLHILEAYRIPDIIIQIIALTYKNTQAKIITPDGETEYFEITKGVLQGDTLAPYLFVITLDYAIRQAIEDREEEPGFERLRK